MDRNWKNFEEDNRESLNFPEQTVGRNRNFEDVPSEGLEGKA